MRYVGLDVHARQTTIALLEPGRDEPRTKTVHGSLKSVLAELAQIKGPFEVAYEASTQYGVLYDLLAPMAHRVVVAHPGKLRAIWRSKNKHDKRDAKLLAQLQRAKVLPEVYVPSVDVRAWRRLVRHRQRLVERRTASKNALRRLLHGVGLTPPKRLWTRRGMAWLEAQSLPRKRCLTPFLCHSHPHAARALGHAVLSNAFAALYIW